MKIIVTDLDGTFLEKDNSIPKNASDFVNHFKNIGFDVIFATARPIGDIKNQVLKFVKPDWVICNDGAIALNLADDATLISIENNLSDISVKDFSTYFNNIGLKPLFFMGSKHNFKVYIPNTTSSEEEKHIKMSDPTREVIRYDDINTIQKQGCIRSLSLYGDIKNEIFEIINNANNDMVNIMFYKETRFLGKVWLDIISSKADKALVANDIANIKGCTKIDIALGNGLNDLSLISKATWSSCPNTAIDEIKNRVTFISSQNEGELFLTEVIEKWRVNDG